MIQLTSSTQRVLIVASPTEHVTPLIAPLREAGCWVQMATNVKDAVRLAAALNPTIVVVGDSDRDIDSMQLSMQIREVVSPEVVPLFIMAPSCESVDCVESANGVADQGISAIVCQIGRLLGEKKDRQPRCSPPNATHRSIEESKIVEENSDATGEPSAQVRCHGVCLDRDRHRAWAGDAELHLTPTEFKLMWELVVRPGYVLSRDDLARVCKGTSSKSQSRTIDAHIKSIRRKLADRAKLVETVHGVGYRFRDTEW